MSIEEYEKELAESYNGFDKQEDGSYIINFCGRPHLILPFGSSRKFKTKEQALNEYKKGLKKMKTVKDVVAAYPDGWPDEAYICVYDKVTNSYRFAGGDYAGHHNFYIICDREEYEQELLKANIGEGIDHAISQATELLGLPRCMITGVAPVNEQWYDYDKQKAINLPPVGVECEYESTFFTHEPSNSGKCKVISYYNGKAWVDNGVNEYVINLSKINFRPLDYDKNKQRNEFIDECVRVTTLSTGQAVIAFGDLYDAGARFK